MDIHAAHWRSWRCCISVYHARMLGQIQVRFMVAKYFQIGLWHAVPHDTVRGHYDGMFRSEHQELGSSDEIDQVLGRRPAKLP